MEMEQSRRGGSEAVTVICEIIAQLEREKHLSAHQLGQRLSVSRGTALKYMELLRRQGVVTHASEDGMDGRIPFFRLAQPWEYRVVALEARGVSLCSVNSDTGAIQRLSLSLSDAIHTEEARETALCRICARLEADAADGWEKGHPIRPMDTVGFLCCGETEAWRWAARGVPGADERTPILSRSEWTARYILRRFGKATVVSIHYGAIPEIGLFANGGELAMQDARSVADGFDRLSSEEQMAHLSKTVGEITELLSVHTVLVESDTEQAEHVAKSLDGILRRRAEKRNVAVPVIEVSDGLRFAEQEMIAHIRYGIAERLWKAETEKIRQQTKKKKTPSCESV